MQQDMQQSAVQMPRLDEAAPDFEATTTHGVRKLANYRGRWLILFSHPADFTPVCTTEFMAFARHYEDFQELKCDLLGLSIDSTFSHLAWVRNIKEKFGVDIPFPIIEDISMQVANAYGMVQPGASTTYPDTVRAADVAFIQQARIDPQAEPEGYWHGTPDLAVEVVSPNDLYTEVDAKVTDWLDAGTRMVIVINPRKHTVTVYRSLTHIMVLREPDILDGDDVVPGWSLPIAAIFS